MSWPPALPVHGSRGDKLVPLTCQKGRGLPASEASLPYRGA